MPRGKASAKRKRIVETDASDDIIGATAGGPHDSKWLARMASNPLVIKRGREAVRQWEKENGAFTPEEIAAAQKKVDRRLGKP